MLAPTRMRVRAWVQLALVVLQVVPFLQLVPMSWAAHAPTPALGSRLATTAGPKNAERNVSIALGSNNVQGEVPHKGVVQWARAPRGRAGRYKPCFRHKPITLPGLFALK